MTHLLGASCKRGLRVPRRPPAVHKIACGVGFGVPRSRSRPCAPVITPAAMRLSASPGGKLSGTVAVPGDKSVSHRALILAALAAGTSRIQGLLEGEDVLRTMGALTALGARFERTGEHAW